jgi:hypothetical protein
MARGDICCCLLITSVPKSQLQGDFLAGKKKSAVPVIDRLSGGPNQNPKWGARGGWEWS